MRFASLGSGSEGNALLVEAGDSRVMLDCGFGLRETERRLNRLGCKPSDLHAIVITHEHADHIGSAYSLASSYRLPLYMSYGTYQVTKKKANIRGRTPDIRFCQADHTVHIGELALHPYTVPHDAREPLQFVFQAGDVRIGVLTDVGMSTPYLIKNLQGLHAFVLEFNHDHGLLAASNYPASLKSRIGGNFGHLANHIAAKILSEVVHPNLKMVVAAHLSQQNNTREHTLSALNQVYQGHVHIACQEQGFDWLSVHS